MTSKAGNNTNVPQGPTMGQVDTLACIYCRASVHFVGLPATRYVEHLFKEHNILYDLEYVVKRTLSLKNQESAEKETSSVGVQVNCADLYPLSTFFKNLPEEKELVVKVKREYFTMDPGSINEPYLVGSCNPNYKEIRKKLPWYAGCEYVCKECDKLYFYSEDLRKHIKEKHGDPDEYLDKHHRFVTKVVTMPCIACDKDIKRHFNSILMHLRNHHDGMTIEEYRRKFKVPAKYEVVIKVFDKDATEHTDSIRKRAAEQQSKGKEKIKKRAFVDQSFPRKVTRSHSHLSGGEDDHGSTQECLRDKTTDTTSMMSDEEKENTETENQEHISTQTLDRPVGMDENINGENVESNSNLFRSPLNIDEPMYPVALEVTEEESDVSEQSKSSKINNEMKKEEKTPWYANGCEYVCQECSVTFYDISQLILHLKSVHKTIRIKNYFKTNKGRRVKTTFYTCQLCKVRLRLQHSTIRRHLKKVHHIQMKSYTERFHPNNSLEYEGCSTVDTKENGLQSKHLDKKAFEEWIKGSCRFACKICDSQFHLSTKLWMHIKQCHSKTSTEYKDQFGDPCLTPSNILRCHGCLKLIRHDKAHIQRHAKFSHGMSSRDYFITLCNIEHLNGGEDLQFLWRRAHSSTVCENTSDVLTKHSLKSIETNQELNNKQEQSKLDSGISSPFQDADMKRGYDSWSNTSKFRCKACPKTFLNPLSLGIHIRLKHKLSKVQYKEIYANISQKNEAIKHLCQICRNPVNQNQIVLAKHLKRHNISVFKYYIKYIHGQETSTASPVINENVEENGKTHKEVEHSTQANSFDEWVNATEYGCQICDQYESRNYSPLISHLKKAHQISKASYMKKYHSLITKKVMHNCHLCKSSFLQSYIYIYTHLKDKHGVNVHDYYTSYISCNETNGEVDEMEHKENVVVDIKENKEKVNEVQNTKVPQEQNNEGFNEWVNSCTFQCKICLWKTNVKTDLVTHIKISHEMDLPSYKKNFGSGFLTKVYHTCKICQMKVLCCVEMLTLHSKAHGLSPSQYYESYWHPGWQNTNPILKNSDHCLNANLIEEVQVDNKLERKDLIGKDKLERKYLINAQKSPLNLYSNRFNRKEKALSWSSGCTYQCQICDRVYSKSNSFYLHLKVTHNTFTEEYRAKFGSFRTTTIFHECLICNNKIIHTTNLLRNHLKTHNMTMTDYYWEYVVRASDTPDTSICGYQTVIESQLESKTSFDSHIYTPVPSNDIPSQVDAKQCFQSEVGLFSNMTPQPSQSMSHVSPNSSPPITEAVMQWASQCIYNCKICGKDYNRSNSFYLHLRMCHATTPDEYRQRYKTLRSVTIYHGCLICGSNLVQTPCLMRKHFKSHGCSLQDYFVKYIQGRQELFQKVEQKEKKLMVQPSDTEIAAIKREPGEVKREEGCHDEAALQWANKYASACHICKQSYSRNSNLLKHIRVVHKIEVVKYREQYGMHPPTIYHECLVCHEPCAHTYPGLTQHLSIHDMSLAEYHQTFMSPGSNPMQTTCWKDSPIKLSDETLNKDPLSIVDENKEPQPSTSLSSSSSLSSLDPFSTWKDACLYGCKFCNYSTKLRRFMMEHIKSIHNTSSSSYIHQFGALQSKAKYHNCLMCQSPILQDSITLHTHMYHSHHKMTIKEYYEKFVEKLEENKGKIKLQFDVTKNKMLNQNADPEAKNLTQTQIVGDAWSWANQCVYGCRICGKTFQLGNSFYKHIKVSHSESTASYLAKYETLRSSTKMHSCLICKRKILQTAEHLKFHLRTHDNLSLEEYYIRYIATPIVEELLEQQNQNEIGKSITVKSSSSSSPIVRNNREDLFEEDLFEASDDDDRGSADDEDDDEEDLVDKWMNQCIFKCKLCKAQLRSKLEFCQHAMDVHNTNFDNYVDLYGNPMVILNRHLCVICKVSVPFDAEEIQTHLYKHHSMLPHKYYFSYVKSQLEEESKKEIINVKGLKNISITRISKPSTPDSDYSEIQSIKSKLKVSNPLMKPKVMNDNKICYAWNQCSECCKLCDEEFVNFDGTIYLHINKVHQSELRKSCHNMSDYIKKKLIFHTCLICDTNIEFRKTEIVRHLKSTHSSSITDYEMQFKDDLDDIFEDLNSVSEEVNFECPDQYFNESENSSSPQNVEMNYETPKSETIPNLEESDPLAHDEMSSTSFEPPKSFSSSQSKGTEVEDGDKGLYGGIQIKLEIDEDEFEIKDEDEIDIDEFDINKI